MLNLQSNLSITSAFLKSVLCCLFFILPFAEFSHANDLHRISVAERSDGLGYVIRFHFTAAPDSFRVAQPNNSLTQIAVYGNFFIPGSLEKNLRTPIHNISQTRIPGGYGFDINLIPDRNYLSRTYMDSNGRDLLVAYTEVSQREMNTLTDGIQPIEWQNLFITDEPTSEGNESIEEIEIPEPVFEDFFERRSLKFDTIVIDAGHGGRDPGAIGPGGTFEKDVTFAIAKKLGGYINEYLPELNVVYTRTDDTFIDPRDRGPIANKLQGDLFISLHANAAGNRSAQGAEVYILGMHRTQAALESMKRENQTIQFNDGGRPALEELTEDQLLIYELSNSGNMALSQTFAALIERQFALRAMRRSRGVKQAGFVVLYHATMPSVLVELGFISNAEEERYMNSEYGQTILASAIFRAVRDYKETIERSNRNRNSE